MRIRIVSRLLTLLALVVAATACEPNSPPEPAPMDPSATAPQADADKTLYALGAMMGRSLEPFKLTETEWAWIERGAADQALGRGAALDPAEFQQQIQSLYDARTGPSPESIAADAAFVVEQAAAAGAVQYESGLIMTEIVAGSGASPSPTDTVEVHYHGTLRDGTVFDSSVERAEKAKFPLNRVIPCWTEALGRMKVGGKSRLVCPPEIAYGPRGSGKIPPNAPIVFEVELFAIGED